MPTKPVAKKPIPGKPQAVKPARKNVVQKKPAPDKVENLAKEYLAELKEVDVTFEKGTAVLEKYRAKYPELTSYIREIVPGERRIEIRQRLEGEDISLHLFAIRVLEDEVRYEVKLSGDAEHKTVKPPEWLSLLHDKLARIVAKILYARETSKPEKQGFVVFTNGSSARREEGAFLYRYVTDEQRSRRPIFNAALRAAASWQFFCVARSTVMMQIAALRSRLEKQPTDLGRRPRDLGGGALGHAVEGLFLAHAKVTCP